MPCPKAGLVVRWLRGMRRRQSNAPLARWVDLGCSQLRPDPPMFAYWDRAGQVWLVTVLMAWPQRGLVLRIEDGQLLAVISRRIG